jgi:uncharacterized protein
LHRAAPAIAAGSAARFFAAAKGDADLAYDPGSFVWYELITTDVPAAAAFYRDVVGWRTQEASTSSLPYTLFAAGVSPTAGLMELPEEGRRMGARPRWMGYIAVEDVPATADRIKRLGGAVYVPPTDTNIGRISVVADSYAATFAVVDHLLATPQQAIDSGKLGHIGWHELFAADLDMEAAFYCELFGWQKVVINNHSADAYLSFSAGGQEIGGALRKRSSEPVPFWLFYFNVEDLDAAVDRVSAGGGRALLNDVELPSGLWIARCVDPHGAAFALQGKRAHALKLGWSTEWRGVSSRGQLVTPKPRRPSEDS